MALTRTHFNDLARFLAEAKDLVDTESAAILEKQLLDFIEKHSRNFNRVRFLNTVENLRKNDG